MRFCLSELRLNRIISECINRVINENRVVTFNGRTYPHNGWCVILSGGPGSGKGFVNNFQLPIDGKTINVDDFKEMFVKMNGNKINGEDYDSRNPEHVSYVHSKVKEKDWKGKWTNSLMNPETHSPDRLPNIIFDMTGKKPNKNVINIVKQAKSVGYNTMLVWVVSNRCESMIRNLQRKRRVKDVILHDIHNSLAREMPPFLNSPQSVEFLDDAWLVFGSTEDLHQPEFTEEEKKSVSVRLTKGSDGFKMDDATHERLMRYLGKIETNPEDPEVYISSDEILDRYGERVNRRMTKPNWSDLTSPKSKEVNGLRINRTEIPDNFYK